MNKWLNFGGDPDPDPDRDTGKTYLGGGMRCPCVSSLLWSPYGIGQTIMFSCCFFFLLSFFISSPNLSGQRLDVYHTSTYGVALVRI